MHAHVKASQTRRCSADEERIRGTRGTQGKERPQVIRERRASSGDQGKEGTPRTEGKEWVLRLLTVLDVPLLSAAEELVRGGGDR